MEKKASHNKPIRSKLYLVECFGYGVRQCSGCLGKEIRYIKEPIVENRPICKKTGWPSNGIIVPVDCEGKLSIWHCDEEGNFSHFKKNAIFGKPYNPHTPKTESDYFLEKGNKGLEREKIKDWNEKKIASLQSELVGAETLEERERILEQLGGAYQSKKIPTVF